MSSPKERNLQKVSKIRKFLAEKKMDYVNLIIHNKNERFIV